MLKIKYQFNGATNVLKLSDFSELILWEVEILRMGEPSRELWGNVVFAFKNARLGLEIAICDVMWYYALWQFKVQVSFLCKGTKIDCC